jgi:hypothetical protein
VARREVTKSSCGGTNSGDLGLCRAGAVALDVELDDVEEHTGDEGAEHEATLALHHPLQRHDDAQPIVCV